MATWLHCVWNCFVFFFFAFTESSPSLPPSSSSTPKSPFLNPGKISWGLAQGFARKKKESIITSMYCTCRHALENVIVGGLTAFCSLVQERLRGEA
ncbi:hypothetical protein BDZ91DRAFT_752512 [Kalaharituber pfeilii]|nr:hypothetical protein BDZ91DRAFT_752512 [Kalaharituber pfeilii]